MAIFKCKMCGGELDIQPKVNIADCPYCGTKQTVPFLDDDKILRLYNRANQYRLDNEFDKAYSAYEAIINDKEDEAEAYWGLILSEYAIEYIEDPVTSKRIPTCHRTLLKSVTSNENFKAACRYADSESKMIYEEEAETLEQLRRNVLNASLKEEPYDVFLCYKETDADGNRTVDSVLAQDIYNELTRSGMHVFFSRISLEDKLGKDYEPCIYAALSSAKAMVLVTTDSNHCNAVWVKNEWKRYLGFMENDPSKVLIPVYRDISPYTLPDEFSRFQALDFAKLGALQDLIHAVEKIVHKSTNAPAQLGERETALLAELERNLATSRKRNKILIRLLIIFLSFFAIRFVATNWLSDVTLFTDTGFLCGFNDHVALHSVTLSVSFIGTCYLLALSVGAFFNAIFGLRSKLASTVYALLSVAVSGSLVVFHFFDIQPSVTMLVILFLTFLLSVGSAFLSWKKKLISILISSILTLFIAVNTYCFFNSTERQNGRNESINQIRIVYSTEAIRYGGGTIKLSRDEYYDVLSFAIVDGEKAYLVRDEFHNRLAVFEKDVDFLPSNQPKMKVEIISPYINVREEPGLSADKIGKVNLGEKYIAVTTYDGLNDEFTWYEIVLDNGEVGYIASDENDPYLKVIK